MIDWAAPTAEEVAEAKEEEKKAEAEATKAVKESEAEEAAAEAADVADATRTANDAKLVAKLAHESSKVTAPLPTAASRPTVAASAAEAKEEVCPTVDVTDDEKGSEIEGQVSARWRLLSGYVPIAIAAVRGEGGAFGKYAGAAAHFLSSYLKAMTTLQAMVELPLIPWCEQLASKLDAPLTQGLPCSNALLDKEGVPSSMDDLMMGVSCLLGHVRLYWQLSRAHRGLLTRWQQDSSNLWGVSSLLHEIALRLPAAVGSPIGGLGGRDALLSSAGRLAYLTCRLIDGIDTESKPSATPEAVVHLALCGATWLRSGDEVYCRELITSFAVSSKWLSRATTTTTPSGAKPLSASELRGSILPGLLRTLDLSEYSEAQARARATQADPSGLSCLTCEVTASKLPLPLDWIISPCRNLDVVNAQGSVDEKQLVMQLRAALQWILMHLKSPLPGGYGTWIPPAAPLPRPRHLCLAECSMARCICERVPTRAACRGALSRHRCDNIAAWLRAIRRRHDPHG